MRPAFFLFLAAIFAASLTLPAAAQEVRAGGVQPLDRILPQIRRTHPGRFYDADGPSPGPNGSVHYHLKWMTPDGRIEWLDTDARTGRVLSTSPGRDNFDGPAPPPYYAPAPSYPVPEPGYYGGGYVGGFGVYGWGGGYPGGGPRGYGGGGGRAFGGGRGGGHRGR
jgi:hypothetical protein